MTKELQADCFAGAWSKHAQDDGVFDVKSGDLDGTLAGREVVMEGAEACLDYQA